MLAGSVVAGKTVVAVVNSAIVPSPVAGIALPSPLLVNGMGVDSVLWSDFIELSVAPS